MRIIFLLLSIALIFGIAGCVTQKQHYYYLQNPQQVTLFKEKNEARLSGELIAGKDNLGQSVQGAYSITDKFAIAIGWMQYKNASNESINDVNTGSWKGQCYDLAFGYYKDYTKYGLFEIYGGWSYGEQQHNYSSIKEEWVSSGWFGSYLSQTVTPIGSANFVTNKYYVQPSYGYSFDAIDIVVSSRISYLNFSSVKNNVTQGGSANSEVRDFTYNRDYLLFEPAITFRAGWKYAKFHMQYAYTGMGGFSLSRYSINIGLQMSIAQRFWKEENNERPQELN